MASPLGITRTQLYLLSTTSRSWSSTIVSPCYARSSVATKRHYAGQAIQKPQLPKAPRQRSLQVNLREHMDMQDLGMIPTFIMPTGDKKPSLFDQTKLRLKFEQIRLKQTVVGYFGFRVGKLPKTEVGTEAEALYQNMYTAYAAGEADVLREICGSSLFSNFKMRLVSRPRDMSYVWELHNLHGRTSVVDDKIASLPQNLGYIRQAVIRIMASQSLTSYKDNKQVEGSGQVVDKTEYLVLQRKDTSSKPGDWMIWGTTEETTVEDLPKHNVFDFVNAPKEPTNTPKALTSTPKPSISTPKAPIKKAKKSK